MLVRVHTPLQRGHVYLGYRHFHSLDWKRIYVGNGALGSSDPIGYFKTLLIIIAVKAALCFFFFWAARKLTTKKTPQTE
jgi:hypothetical protein